MSKKSSKSKKNAASKKNRGNPTPSRKDVCDGFGIQTPVGELIMPSISTIRELDSYPQSRMMVKLLMSRSGDISPCLQDLLLVVLDQHQPPLSEFADFVSWIYPTLVAYADDVNETLCGWIPNRSLMTYGRCDGEHDVYSDNGEYLLRYIVMDVYDFMMEEATMVSA